jgi:hypothetical protein
VEAWPDAVSIWESFEFDRSRRPYRLGANFLLKNLNPRHPCDDSRGPFIAHPSFRPCYVMSAATLPTVPAAADSRQLAQARRHSCCSRTASNTRARVRQWFFSASVRPSRSHVPPGADCRSSAPFATYLRQSSPPSHRSSARGVPERLCGRVSDPGVDTARIGDEFAFDYGW